MKNEEVKDEGDEEWRVKGTKSVLLAPKSTKRRIWEKENIKFVFQSLLLHVAMWKFALICHSEHHRVSREISAKSRRIWVQLRQSSKCFMGAPFQPCKAGFHPEGISSRSDFIRRKGYEGGFHLIKIVQVISRLRHLKSRLGCCSDSSHPYRAAPFRHFDAQNDKEERSFAQWFSASHGDVVLRTVKIGQSPS